MAQKRMFDKGLLETDAFMDMPMPTKALYFLLGMEADDEGFVSPTRVMRIYGGQLDDLKILVAKNFVIQFESGVIVITDWKKNNWLDSRRVKETVYRAEKALLSESNEKYLLLSGGLASIEQSRVEEHIEFSNENNLSKLPVKNKTKKDFTNAYRGLNGKQPLTPRKSTEKQEAVLEAFKGIEYFKQKGYADHGMQFLEVKNEKRNLIVRKLVIEAQKVLGDLNSLIDWWFSGNGEWASYEPEQCFSSKSIEKFKNSNKIQKKGGVFKIC